MGGELSVRIATERTKWKIAAARSVHFHAAAKIPKEETPAYLRRHRTSLPDSNVWRTIKNDGGSPCIKRLHIQSHENHADTNDISPARQAELIISACLNVEQLTIQGISFRKVKIFDTIATLTWSQTSRPELLQQPCLQAIEKLC